MFSRRVFLGSAAAAALGAAAGRRIPRYKVVTRYEPEGRLGMPGLYPGRVVSVHSSRAMDVETERVDRDVIRRMIERGMCELTGASSSREAWRRFVEPDDVVGIKLNCSGAPGISSTPEVVAEVVRNLVAVGVAAERIYLYERFQNQVDSMHFPRYLPEGVRIVTAERRRGDNEAYDPLVYVEVNFFGEDDTRSNLMRVVSRRLTKIINIPNMKDHGAAGITGCLKNIAYGSFSNVARSHHRAETHTYSFIGTLAAVEPLRSRTVLHIMDGLKGVWHGGPFSPDRKYRFYPKKLQFATDPVAVDRLLIDIIDGKRKQMGAISIWNRDPKYLARGDPEMRRDPNVNLYIREPGHVQYAAGLGLGVYDLEKIRVEEIEL